MHIVQRENLKIFITPIYLCIRLTTIQFYYHMCWISDIFKRPIFDNIYYNVRYLFQIDSNLGTRTQTSSSKNQVNYYHLVNTNLSTFYIFFFTHSKINENRYYSFVRRIYTSIIYTSKTRQYVLTTFTTPK